MATVITPTMVHSNATGGGSRRQLVAHHNAAPLAVSGWTDGNVEHHRHHRHHLRRLGEPHAVRSEPRFPQCVFGCGLLASVAFQPAL